MPDKKAYHAQLLEALCLDLTRWQQSLHNKKLISLYFGGGTPSLLESGEIERLLKHVRSVIPFDAQEIEITLEANPETITQDCIRAFADVGINRLSIGVQTLDDGLLQKLGRTHNAASSLRSIETAYAAGIKNISIDLMYDIPCQTLASWTTTLDAIRSLPISHLSLYNLTIEPHTVFFKYRKSLNKELPDADSSAAMYQLAQSKLQSFGLSQYEISAFAKDNRIARHNVGYWTGRPFIGFGPSAFSYWKGRRFRAASNLNRYSEALQNNMSPEEFTETLDPDARRRELLTIALRLKSGVNMKVFSETYGSLSPETSATIAKLIEIELLCFNDGVLKLTDRGMLFYDTVATDLI